MTETIVIVLIICFTLVFMTSMICNCITKTHAASDPRLHAVSMDISDMPGAKEFIEEMERKARDGKN